VAGEEPEMPRMRDVPVRIPLPAASRQGSIYENQKGLGFSYFETRDRAAAT